MYLWYLPPTKYEYCELTNKSNRKCLLEKYVKIIIFHASMGEWFIKIIEFLIVQFIFKQQYKTVLEILQLDKRIYNYYFNNLMVEQKSYLCFTNWSSSWNVFCTIVKISNHVVFWQLVVCNRPVIIHLNVFYRHPSKLWFCLYLQLMALIILLSCC